MDATGRPVILSIDDDPDVRGMLSAVLGAAGYDVIEAPDGTTGLEAVRTARPDLVLIDYMMPDMNGIEVATRLQADPGTERIPLVFLTAVGGEMVRAQAFALGAVGYLSKPVDNSTLLDEIRGHLETARAFAQIQPVAEEPEWVSRTQPARFVEFKEFLGGHFGLGPEAAATLSMMTPSTVEVVSRRLGLQPSKMAHAISVFLGVGLVSQIALREVRLGVLPTPFAKSNLVVPIKNHLVGDAFVMSNPFNWDVLEALERATPDGQSYTILVAEPDVVLAVFETAIETVRRRVEIDPADHRSTLGLTEIERQPVTTVTDNVLASAFLARADSLSIEQGEARAVVRMRVDGDYHDVITVSSERASMMISRLKAVGGMDISERRRPQRGAIEVGFGQDDYDLILSTTPTALGESISARVIQVGAKPRTLRELGMTPEQEQTIVPLMSRARGLVLIAGPGGSGKTTTAHALLSGIAGVSASVMSIEEPVEYRIPFANQQPIDAKSGVTYEALMQSAHRRSPDALFIGEIRDAETARLAIDYARTRGLVVTTMQAADAFGALARLLEWGSTPAELVEAVLCVVGQRLLKTPCPSCRAEETPTAEEDTFLREYLHEIPAHVAHARGCAQCGGSGARGRAGLFEVVPMGDLLAALLRAEANMSDLRMAYRERTGCSLCQVAIDKVAAGVLSAVEVRDKVLADLDGLGKLSEVAGSTVSAPGAEVRSILVVDDNEDARDFFMAVLQSQGHRVDQARNGVEGLRLLGLHTYDLVLSDLNMPLMGGFDLLERAARGESAPPVILYSSSSGHSDEVRSLRMGAADYVRLPVNPDVVRLRVARAFE